MGAPIVFSGKRSKLLSNKGLLNSNGSINDYNGTINYILNGHAEVNTTGWATYADAAQATPVNGTGGSPSVTWTQTTTSPLDDLASFVFTKDAVNRQGQGASYDFTIDSASQAKVLTVSFDYIVGSGTFVAGANGVDSDLEVYLYDVTNSVLIQPSTYKLYSNSSTVAAKFVSNFQTPYNSTSYRLIFHCATTSASAYTVKFDNVVVSPSQYVYGTPITDWQSFTPTITASTPPSLGTGPTQSGRWRRVGDSIEMEVQTIAGTSPTAGSGTYYWRLPNGYVIDTSKLASAANAAGISQPLGRAVKADSGGVSPAEFIVTCDGSTTGVVLTDVNGNPTTGTNNNIVAGRRYTFTCSVPVLGLSSSVQMSDNAAQNVVACSYNRSATQAVTASVTNITFPNKTFDTTGSFDGTTFTAPVAGYYNITGSYIYATTATGFTIFAYVNATVNIGLGSNNSNGGDTATINGVLYLNAGDALTVRTNATVTLGAGGYLQIHRLAGPNSIGATDTVAASYWLSANFAASATVPINFDSREYDYTGSVTTSATAWKFTAPVAGLYQVSGFMYSSLVSAFYVRIYKNGVYYKIFGINQSGTAAADSCIQLRLLSGDYIDLRPASAATFYGGTLTTDGTSQISICKVGNY